MFTSATPTREIVRERLRALVHEITGVPLDVVVEGATIDQELRMESVAFVELQVSLEDEFGIEIDAVHVVELNDFGAIVDYVHDLAVRAAA
jgi:acyl carrier protein